VSERWQPNGLVQPIAAVKSVYLVPARILTRRFDGARRDEQIVYAHMKAAFLVH
jgi:hypothetical protein